MNKNYLIIIFFLIGLILIGAGYYFLSKDKRGKIDTEEIIIELPISNQIIENSVKITGQAKGAWYFEAEFTAELYDDYDTLLGTAILTAQDEWMTDKLVPFEGDLEFSGASSDSGKLRFLGANPSGLSENQKIFEMPVKFESPKTKILLYYYNPDLDKDESGNIKCSQDGLVAIEKEISVNQTSIPEVIKLLLKGKENLTSEQVNQGITTEFPLEGFSLIEAILKADGVLVLNFNDLENKTIGGSCRVNILWLQIEETAKQFSDVKKVEFQPTELFQP